MGSLIKIKASSLTEVLIATTIIMIIFSVAILTINNILTSMNNQKKECIERKLYELQYLYNNNLIKLPYEENYKNSHIFISINRQDSIVKFEAKNSSFTMIKKQYLFENK